MQAARRDDLFSGPPSTQSLEVAEECHERYQSSVAVLTSLGTANAQQVLKVGVSPITPGVPPLGRDAIQLIAKDAGLQIQLTEMPFGDLVQALVDKKIDIISSLVSPTPERAKLIDFCAPYASYRDVAFQHSGIRSLEFT